MCVATVIIHIWSLLTPQRALKTSTDGSDLRLKWDQRVFSSWAVSDSVWKHSSAAGVLNWSSDLWMTGDPSSALDQFQDESFLPMHSSTQSVLHWISFTLGFNRSLLYWITSAPDHFYTGSILYYFTTGFTLHFNGSVLHTNSSTQSVLRWINSIRDQFFTKPACHQISSTLVQLYTESVLHRIISVVHRFCTGSVLYWISSVLDRFHTGSRPCFCVALELQPSVCTVCLHVVHVSSRTVWSRVHW